MAKLVTFVLITFFSLFALLAGSSGTVKNIDTPLKGDWNFDLREVWSVDTAGEEVLVRVSAIRTDADGKVYVLDNQLCRFFVFSPAGKFLYSFGKKGEGPGEFKMVHNFFLMGRYLIAPDMGTFHYFTKEGKYVKSVKPGSMIFPRAFIDENRFLMVMESDEQKKENEKLEIYEINSKKRSVIAEIEPEKSMQASMNSSRGTMVIRMKDSNSTPMVVVSVDKNNLFFGKNSKYLIKKTDLNGKELFSFSIEGRKKKKIPMEFKMKRLERVSFNGGRMPKDMRQMMAKSMPDQCTYFNSPRIDETGLIYVPINDLTNETGQEYDIFSPEGKYLYHADLQLPNEQKLTSGPTIHGNFVYAFIEDEEGENKLVKYKIKKPLIK
ncbi:MAG: 6-bladed beta-propeller [bacterium]|nr:6-bladed beta-propeller [bacterium]